MKFPDSSSVTLLEYIVCVIYKLRSFFFNDTATTEIYTLSLHDALPILSIRPRALTRSGSASARRKATRPPSELPATAARSIPKASRYLEIKRVKKAGE